MTTRALVTRRMLLKDMGRAGIAVIVLGAAACSEDPADEVTPTSEPASTSSASSTPASSIDQPAGHQWGRANLGFVSAYILHRNGEAAIVDTGVEGSERSIEMSLGEIGLGWDAVGHLIITHKHPDHQGSLERVLEASNAPWYAGAGDIGAIRAPIDGSTVGDGDAVFDLEIVETPGHTPGHISVHDPASGVLVAGDALNGVDGGVAGPNPDFSEDMDLANASVVKLAEFDYEVALFGHGEPVLEGASGQVADLADSLNGG